jgi:Na+-transporting methylmalonyl-CoA/oxaloacetate decarboxylase gamma subunit
MNYRRFLRRWAVLILFVVVLVGLGLVYHRQENLISVNRERAVQEKVESCASRTEARENLKALLLSIVQDFVPPDRPARRVIERRIDDYLGVPPDDCRDVPDA